MGKRHLALTLFVALAACSSKDGTPALAYKNPRDILVIGLGLERILGDTCHKPIYRDGKPVGVMFVGEADCFKFRAPQRFRGVWLDEFTPVRDASLFFEGEDKLPPVNAYYKSGTWLEPGKTSLPDQVGACWAQEGRCAFAVEFVGRHSAYRGHYGHKGDSPNIIVINKVLSIRELPRPPGPPLKVVGEVELPPVNPGK